MTPIIESSDNPYLNRKVDIARVFVPAKIADNKIGMQNDPTYFNRLMGMDEAERNALLFGDWDALEGTYFSAFRPRHRDGEPDNACHVISLSNRKLEPWWPRWIGADWGYKHCSAIFWGCQDPTDMVIIYRELVAAEASSYELGMAIATASIEDLRGLERKKHAYVFFSRRVFASRRD